MTATALDARDTVRLTAASTIQAMLPREEGESHMNADPLDRRIEEIERELLRNEPRLGKPFTKLDPVNRRHEATVDTLLVSSFLFLMIGLATMSIIAWLAGAVSLIASFSIDIRHDSESRAIERASEVGRRRRRPGNRQLRCRRGAWRTGRNRNDRYRHHHRGTHRHGGQSLR